MTNPERAEVLLRALDHQFDDDDNALLVLPTEDQILRIAVVVINEFSSYTDILVGPDEEFFRLLATVVREVEKVKT
jgi:hypothetical protein